jgi:hypothetical protein
MKYQLMDRIINTTIAAIFRLELLRDVGSNIAKQ